jgi:hypothetical protein
MQYLIENQIKIGEFLINLLSNKFFLKKTEMEIQKGLLSASKMAALFY